MQKKLKEIAEIVGGELIGNGDIKITGLNSIDTARAGDLTFADEKHVAEAKNCAASAVIIPKNFTGEIPKNSIKSAEPKIAFAKLMEIFKPQIKIPAGISSQAYIGNNTKIAPTAKIMAFAYIDDNAEISDGAIIYPHTYIGQNAKIGKDTIIYSSVTIREYCEIGARCVIHASAVIGADGFGFTTKNGVHTKVPQIGNVIVEDDVEIGAHVGIDRAAMGSTVIGHGTKIDNLVHIAHNCKIGANCLIVALTGISGSTIVGDNVTFGGQTGTVGHIKIGGHSVYAGRSGITKNMPEGFFGSGFPVQPHNDWLRSQAAIQKIPDLMKKIRQLEDTISNLNKSKGGS
ncbi:MAG: UDP-3-O-(3-hydroxymyristoyl)glucosamine N-acyltransferase [Selenomonadaceae bacterium]|nr:UDP-3-O-(3-hydroxymyristoyl)glucosamine N-acyltransferase [Selenomonadaceae bacterium]